MTGSEGGTSLSDPAERDATATTFHPPTRLRLSEAIVRMSSSSSMSMTLEIVMGPLRASGSRVGAGLDQRTRGARAGAHFTIVEQPRTTSTSAMRSFETVAQVAPQSRICVGTAPPSWYQASPPGGQCASSATLGIEIDFAAPPPGVYVTLTRLKSRVSPGGGAGSW